MHPLRVQEVTRQKCTSPRIPLMLKSDMICIFSQIRSTSIQASHKKASPFPFHLLSSCLRNRLGPATWVPLRQLPVEPCPSTHHFTPNHFIQGHTPDRNSSLGFIPRSEPCWPVAVYIQVLPQIKSAPGDYVGKHQRIHSQNLEKHEVSACGETLS